MLKKINCEELGFLVGKMGATRQKITDKIDYNVGIKTLIIGIGFSVLIEILQLVLPINRSPQLSDIILNSLSCLIGILSFNLFKFIVMKLKSKKKKTIYS